MFCHGCGNKISDNEKFCVVCGTENKLYKGNNENKTTVVRDNTSANENGFDRNVLINYLGNLRTLELLRSKMYDEKAKLERENNVILKKSYNKVIYIPPILIILLTVPFMVVGSIISNYFRSISTVGEVIKWVAIIVLVAFFIYSIVSYIKTKSEFKKHLEEDNQQRNINLQVIPNIQRDIMQNERLLNEAYSLNIIPTKYRNVCAIYFLYDYMTSSNATISEAFYQCVLDEINQKLDIVIKQQRDSLILSARQNALNEQIVRQNNEILKHAIAIERNTELSAQYSRIAAINTETTAQIQTYYFFKNRF